MICVLVHTKDYDLQVHDVSAHIFRWSRDAPPDASCGVGSNGLSDDMKLLVPELRIKFNPHFDSLDLFVVDCDTLIELP